MTGPEETTVPEGGDAANAGGDVVSADDGIQIVQVDAQLAVGRGQ